MKLTNLKPRLGTVEGRIATLAPARPDTVQRKRGWAGVQDRDRIRRRDNGLCQQCLQQGRTAIGSVVDHKDPLWNGGSDDDGNKWLLCTPCHDAKTAKEAADRARQR